MSRLSSSKTLIKLSLVLLLLFGLGACETLNYFHQAARGQISILWNRQQIEDLLQKDDVSQQLKEKLNTVVSIREFAEEQLLLPAGGSYRSYVDLERDHVVWNVFAAPEFSVEPLAWCYPIAGCVSYRGYFSRDKAVNFASTLEQDGYDVYTGGVDAYSTLGWFNDPLLSSVINRADYQLAALLFHELAHRRVYLPGDTTFNESFATMVEKEGLRRWLSARGDSQSIILARQQGKRQQQFIDLVISFRNRFDKLYESELSEQNKRSRKNALQQEMRLAYEALKNQWGGVTTYDRWFASSLNNAQLSTVASYNEMVPEFEEMLTRLDGDLGAFYQEVAALAESINTH